MNLLESENMERLLCAHCITRERARGGVTRNESFGCLFLDIQAGRNTQDLSGSVPMRQAEPMLYIGFQVWEKKGKSPLNSS